MPLVGRPPDDETAEPLRRAIRFRSFIQGVRRSAVTGELPPGTCSFIFTLGASNTTAGSGTLVPGGATARFELKDMYGRVVDTSTVSVTLVN